MLSTIGAFLEGAVGKQFFLQYFFSKGLDKVFNKVGSKELIGELWELFDEAYKCLCEQNGWEYNMDIVHNSLQKNSIAIDKLSELTISGWKTQNILEYAGKNNKGK